MANSTENRKYVDSFASNSSSPDSNPEPNLDPSPDFTTCPASEASGVITSVTKSVA